LYNPAHFDESSPEAIDALIADHPLGILITRGPSGLDANHLPFELRRDRGDHGVLHTHVARPNPVWRDVSNGDEVLVVFRVADAYISPNWYPSTHDTHKLVPTWNYIVAHAHGRITVHDDENYVREVVSRLTATQEDHRPEPWRLSDSAPGFIDALVKGIVGLEIEITRLVGKSKLSQNREERDLRSAGQMVKAEGQRIISEAMLRRADMKSKSTD
jgi:transcriptional regulator